MSTATVNLQHTTDSVEVPAPGATPEVPSALPEGVPYRLSADEFFRMVDADVIPRDRRVGLWEGQLYGKMAKKLPHWTAANKVNQVLMRILPEGWFLGLENPILVNDLTAPLPDFVVARGTTDDYFRGKTVPMVGDIGLVIEVADSSLRKNLTVSLQTYARAGLPIYWVVNLVANRVEVYSEPRTDEAGVAGYAQTEFCGPGGEIPLVLDGHEVGRVPVADLLPEGAA